MDFAVRVKGLDEPDGQTCRWVLHIEGDRFLSTDNEGALHWYDRADCTFVKSGNPDLPRPVVVVQPQQPGLITPNRVVRRAMERNGGS